MLMGDSFFRDIPLQVLLSIFQIFQLTLMKFQKQIYLGLQELMLIALFEWFLFPSHELNTSF
jgi:hypothetical protein